MFKKSIFIITTIMLCATTARPQEKDNRYRVGELTLTNTEYLAKACVAVSLISAMPDLSEEHRSKILWTLFGIAVVTTGGCVIVDAINGVDHWINPANKNNPELKADIKKVSEQKQ